MSLAFTQRNGSKPIDFSPLINKLNFSCQSCFLLGVPEVEKLVKEGYRKLPMDPVVLRMVNVDVFENQNVVISQ